MCFMKMKNIAPLVLIFAAPGVCITSGDQGAFATKNFCPDKLRAIYADMHDGDQKEIAIAGTSMTIRPSGNNQTWVVKSEVNTTSCSASVNFNVPGKPSPPPVNLMANLRYSISATGTRTEWEFTDPSGTLASEAFPLNLWVELGEKVKEKMVCPISVNATYADMHDGDKKEVILSKGLLTIKPSGNNQTWVVKSELDASCTASIDFNVPGKPSPPPVNLTATFSYTISPTTAQSDFEFTDPSGTLASADFPLNRWVEIGSEEAALEIVI
mmetsp:Transcript_231/g.480  ORF Transcript_231/g.480 Transcript_231/m.480 type:complete len:270 (-) Transcript_231:36-845(-)